MKQKTSAKKQLDKEWRRRKMQSKSPIELARTLTEAGFTSSDPIVGCSEEDILELEQRFAVALPAAYKDFLRVMGRQAGNFLNDGSWRYPLKYAHQNACDHIEAEDSAYTLPETAFVFLSRDNFFLMFDTVSGNDPPVYIFEDGAKEPRLFFDSFSNWLTVCVEHDAKNRINNDLARTNQ